jgi:hypothetical protein
LMYLFRSFQVQGQQPCENFIIAQRGPPAIGRSLIEPLSAACPAFYEGGADIRWQRMRFIIRS